MDFGIPSLVFSNVRHTLKKGITSSRVKGLDGIMEDIFCTFQIWTQLCNNNTRQIHIIFMGQKVPAIYGTQNA